MHLYLRGKDLTVDRHLGKQTEYCVHTVSCTPRSLANSDSVFQSISKTLFARADCGCSVVCGVTFSVPYVKWQFARS